MPSKCSTKETKSLVEPKDIDISHKSIEVKQSLQNSSATKLNPDSYKGRHETIRCKDLRPLRRLSI